jgi:hypothetical protein
MLSPYQAQFLPPGWGVEFQTAETDISGWLYAGSSIGSCLQVPYALLDGTSRDAGNTGFTSVLRPGLIMAQVTATGKWKQFDNAAVDGTQFARGILGWYGLNTQLAGADQDRWMANIIIGNACLQPNGLCIAASATYGIATTGAGLAVRKHFLHAFQFCDDFMGAIPAPFAGR